MPAVPVIRLPCLLCSFIQQYFEDSFDLNITLAGVLSSLFGICNIAARPLGEAAL
jgi:hypothetical protein